MRALLLTHLVALIFYWLSPGYWAVKDLAAFAANGAADTLHQGFHRQRLAIRAGTGALVALAASAPAWTHWGAFACSSGALLSFGAAYFFYDFNPRLSRLRKLPAYYVSLDPNAAWFPDRWLACRAKHAVAWPPKMLTYDESEVIVVQRQLYASRQLQQLGRWVLETGALCYALLTLLAFVLL